MPTGKVLILGEGNANLLRSAQWWEADGYHTSVIDFDREGLLLSELEGFDMVVLDHSLSARDRRSYRMTITGTGLGIPVLPHG